MQRGGQTDDALILLPPSEGKAAGGENPPLDLDSLSFESLNSVRMRMANALVKLSERPRVRGEGPYAGWPHSTKKEIAIHESERLDLSVNAWRSTVILEIDAI